MGAAGVLLWSSYYSTETVARCDRLFDAFTTEVGPLVRRAQQRLARCAVEKCEGGRAVSL